MSLEEIRKVIWSRDIDKLRDMVKRLGITGVGHCGILSHCSDQMLKDIIESKEFNTSRIIKMAIEENNESMCNQLFEMCKCDEVIHMIYDERRVDLLHNVFTIYYHSSKFAEYIMNTVSANDLIKLLRD